MELYQPQDDGFNPHDFEARFKAEFVRLTGDVRDEVVIAAFSGGPDSTALFRLLSAVREDLGFRPVAAHLDHGLRGKAGEADREWCRSAAVEAGVPFISERADCPALAKTEKLSVEEAARRARYEFLSRAGEKVKARWIVVGHNADDNAESVLLNLLRGSGPLGLSGIPPRRGFIIRPLLNFRRWEIVKYLDAVKADYVFDETNKDERFLRNKVRRGLIPILERDFNPRLCEALNRTAALMRDEETVWGGLTDRAGREAGRRSEDGRVSFNLSAFAAQERALARRLVRGAGLEAQGSIRAWSVENVESVLDLATAGRGAVDLPGEVRAWVRGGRLFIGKPESFAVDDFEFQLEAPERLELKELGLVLTTWFSSNVPTASELKKTNPGHAILDADRIRPPLMVRSFRPGDRFTPLGFSGTRKLSDFFIDLKIPAKERMRTPLVCDSDGIIWIAGIRPADRVRVRQSARRVLHLILSGRGSDRTPGSDQEKNEKS